MPTTHTNEQDSAELAAEYFGQMYELSPSAFSKGYFDARWNHRLMQLGNHWLRNQDREIGPPYIYTRGEDTRDWSDAEVSAYEAGFGQVGYELGYDL